MRTLLALLALLLVAASLDAQLTRQDWLRADEDTVRLKPSAFPDVPPAVRTELERRGCTIPQPASADNPKNAVSGSFIRAGQTDWTVLCSREKRSSILIFRAGASDHVDELGGAPDLNYLQVISRDGKIGYSRSLKAISPNSLRTRFSKSTVPKIIDHHGIEDTMIEKGSTIWYWFRASWMRIGGSE
jgi:hypothetical protein